MRFGARRQNPTTSLRRGPGPSHPVNARPLVGLTSLQPWVYDLTVRLESEVVAGLDGCDLVGRVVGEDDELTYAIHAVFDPDEHDVRDSYAATAAALDLHFDDGHTLSERTVLDQHGVELDPRSQYLSRTIAVDQWTLKRVRLTGCAGLRIVGVALRLAPPPRITKSHKQRRLRGFVDEMCLRPCSAPPPERIHHVRTTRGTHSSDRFSRGNCAPLVAPPHGSVFGLPMTDAGNRGWPYSYHEANDAENRSHLNAFATSHIPSPWMGDRGVLQFFPSALSQPSLDRGERALEFSHHHESDRPDRYAVPLGGGSAAGGVDAELTAGTWSVWLRIGFPSDVGSLIFDQLDGRGSLVLSDASRGVITGFVDGPGGLVDVPRMYFAARVDVPVTATRHAPGRHERSAVLGAVTLDVAQRRSAVLAIGTSFIGVDQAARNLDYDIWLAGGGFDAIWSRSRAAWDAVLGRLDIRGASDDQLVTAYSSLHRVHLYPTIAHENVGTPERPRWAYADPFVPPVDDAPTRTARPVVDGKLSVTDGFWDSYRASWPLRTLVWPTETGELVDGFVEHFRRSGWTSRWSAPGPADIMTGTSSDAVFADAALADLPGLDLENAYDACLRNATTPSSNPRVGRKGMSRSLFQGFTDTDTAEGMSWTVDAAINDAAIATFSRILAQRFPSHPRSEEFRTNALWFDARAASYATVFDAETGFFRGRDRSGDFRPLRDFDPRRWGIDYTETNAWGTAFTAPHDGEGLATLHGGRAALEKKLDEFCATPETGSADMRGSYPVVIHEMREARDTRMGMLALSNQPAHHIPFMYAHASTPGSFAHAKTQALIRDATQRLFLGSEIGQGYPGDEDNGEMSAWYLWAVTGLYPLSIGSGEYVITAPTFPWIRWTLDNGATLTVDAPAASSTNRYIESVTIDGQPWSHITVSRERLMRGAHITIALGPAPTTWAAGTVPASTTPEGAAPQPPRDLTSPQAAPTCARGPADSTAVFDDDSSTTPLLLPAGHAVGWAFDAPTLVDHYTVTPHSAGELGWLIEVLDDAGTWIRVDDRRASFRWDRQTRIFALPTASTTSEIRLRTLDDAELAQLEFLRLTSGDATPEVLIN
ncbi:glycoside hydrolase [Gordonia sp. 852002-50816_SCH5313054-c]|uniref:GH92 family glycosyl hydrolase n=1 Tax=unclassified Gordonia (in: high G+C Gram-positive bacteria) TaxID=2657482 RepID=UPI0007EBB04D|nr:MULTISPECIES: GH92 family glycosyl hydrolase [unclassified Gordonia (in: high G+C Gram-positive bacteria)]OBC12724.1 glycoside hydrolase [Gordonia sp. 852002-50816_SCH5313054-a]OBC18719.1 glycoside hydrolase [Gordonia sp. 852002-50816_SCH5313054-c]